MSNPITRRELLRSGAAASASVLIGSAAMARTYSANEKIRFALIGVGGMGGKGVGVASGEQIVAAADVDVNHAAGSRYGLCCQFDINSLEWALRSRRPARRQIMAEHVAMCNMAGAKGVTCLKRAPSWSGYWLPRSFLCVLAGMILFLYSCPGVVFFPSTARRAQKCSEVKTLMLIVEGFTLKNHRLPRTLSEIPDLEEWRAKKGDFAKFTDLDAFFYWPENYHTGRWVVALEYEDFMIGADEKSGAEVLRRNECGSKTGGWRKPSGEPKRGV